MLLTVALKIAFVSISLGLDTFAVCVGVGMRGADRGVKIRIGAAFAFSEVSMTFIGVIVGATAVKYLGDIAGYLGFAALTAVGAYMIYESVRGESEIGIDLSSGWGLFVGALSMSLDALGIGFSILFIGVPLPVSLACIAVSSVLSTTLGLTLGKTLGARLGAAAALWAGILLTGTGLAFAALRYWGIG